MKKRQNGIVREYLEKVSWQVLDRFRPDIKQQIRGHAGIYALYKGEKLYYVGLATNLMGRVNHHLKDRHQKKWDRFSVYLTTDNDHIRPLEALLLRIVDPKGNRVKGHLRGAVDLARSLKRAMETRVRDETATLLGGRFARHRRRAKTRSVKGTVILGGLDDKRMTLRASYKGHRYVATLRRDGQISYEGKLYSSPSAVARIIVRRAANGWSFWKYRNPKGQWVRLSELKG